MKKSNLSNLPKKDNAKETINKVPVISSGFGADLSQGNTKHERAQYQVKSFQPKEFIPHKQPEIDLFSTITISGKRRTGKSVWVKWFLQFYKQYFPWYWVFTKTEQNNFYKTFIPEKFIIHDFNPDKMRKIMERQKKALAVYVNENDDFNARITIVWDDYSGDDIRYNQALNEYYYTGRHYASLNLFCAQVCLMIEL
jgi:hypothetical protein